MRQQLREYVLPITFLALLAAPVSTDASDRTTTVGFVSGSGGVIHPACGLADDSGGLGRSLMNAGLTEADILPGSRERSAFEASVHEARLLLTAKLNRDKLGAFYAFARQRHGTAGLGLVRG